MIKTGFNGKIVPKMLIIQETQAEAVGPAPQQLFHGRQVSRLLQVSLVERLERFCCNPASVFRITTVFSHAQTVVVCAGCSTVLCQPTGGRARLTEGCSFRRKQH